MEAISYSKLEGSKKMMRGDTVVDGRNIYDENDLLVEKLFYIRIGR